jgi:hypothetical protein
MLSSYDPSLATPLSKESFATRRQGRQLNPWPGSYVPSLRDQIRRLHRESCLVHLHYRPDPDRGVARAGDL